MPISRGKYLLLIAALIGVAVPCFAQIQGGRDASFLPMPAVPVNSAEPAPEAVAPAPTTPPETLPVVQVPVVQAPVVGIPTAQIPAMQIPTSQVSAPPSAPVIVEATKPVLSTPATAAPMIIAPPAAKPAAAVATPVSTSVPAAPSAAAVPAAASASAPIAPAAPAAKAGVEAANLQTIDADSVGILDTQGGGLGASMWKGTPRDLVSKLFPSLQLPTPSPALNNLARRFLLTTAAAPAGNAENGAQSLLSMRVEKLLALGDAKDAWAFVVNAKSGQIDEIILRLAAEAALVSDQRANVCPKLPDIMKEHTSPEWQKLMLVCQLRANDMKAAQLTLDMLHTQNVKDDIFLFVADKNIIGGAKQIPRQLTPLKPLTLALLRITDQPLPGDIYAHPDAALIPELLAAKSREDNPRLGLAEHAAERGLLDATQLAAIYSSAVFTPEAIAAAATTGESGPRLHALLYQASMHDQQPQNRINDAVRFIQTSTPAFLKSPAAQILAAMLGDIQPKDDYIQSSAAVAHIYMLAGKPDAAMAWMALAKRAAIGVPAAAAELQALWPLAVFAGLEDDKNFSADLDQWLEGALKNADPKTISDLRSQLRSILLLFGATGFAVPDSAWVKVMDAPQFEKRLIPETFLFERMQSAAKDNRRGETVLLALLVAGNSDISFLVDVEVIRAMRAVGLAQDAGSLARETAIGVMAAGK